MFSIEYSLDLERVKTVEESKWYELSLQTLPGRFGKGPSSEEEGEDLPRRPSQRCYLRLCKDTWRAQIPGLVNKNDLNSSPTIFEAPKI